MISKAPIIFDKVKEKVNSEIDDIEVRLEQDQEKRKEMKKNMEEQRAKDHIESQLTEAERIAKHEEEKYDLEKRMLKEGVLREKAEYLKVKIGELVTFLSHEGVKVVNGKPLKDVMTSIEDVDKTYYELKEIVDDINDKKKDEAAKYANKLMTETSYTERAKRIYEEAKLKEELKQRNETDMKDLLNYLETKHANDVKMKHLLMNSTKSRDIYLKQELEKRQKELEGKVAEYMKEQTEIIKKTIINNAKTKWRKEENKRLMEENKKRFAATAAKADKESVDDESTGGFTRAGFGTQKAEAQPDRPRPTYENKGKVGDRKPRQDDGGFNRAGFGKADVEKPTEEEKSKQKTSGPPQFGRSGGGPPKFGGKSKGADADSWKRGPTVKADDKPKEENKPKFTNKKKDKNDGGDDSVWRTSK